MTTVDVWCVHLDADAQAEHDAWNLLTPAEQRAAGRYRNAHDRAAHIRTRALLRSVLGTSVEIVDTAHGKPVVAGGRGPRFSVTHSRALAVVATCATAELGVDVEPRREFPWREVADRFFAPAEIAAIDAQAVPLDAFFATWVRKEAYLKGVGLGFQDVSAGFAVPLDDGFVPATTWYLQGLDLDAGHAGALAIEGGPATVVVHDAR